CPIGNTLPGGGCCPIPDICGGLIGRINSGSPFLVCSISGMTLLAGQQLYLGINDLTCSDNSGWYSGTLVVTPACEGFEVLGAFTEDKYYTPGETAHVSVTTRNNECPMTTVRLVVETRSQGVPGLDDYFQVADVQFDLPQSPTPNQTELSWIVPSILFPTNVGVRATLSRVSDGQQLAQQWFPDVYTVSLMSHETWQGTLDAIENCAPEGFDCATEVTTTIPLLNGATIAAQFANGVCEANQSLQEGDMLGFGLGLGSTVLSTTTAIATFGMSSAALSPFGVAFSCGGPIIHEYMPELDPYMNAAELIYNLGEAVETIDNLNIDFALSGVPEIDWDNAPRGLSLFVPQVGRRDKSGFCRSTLDTMGIYDGLVVGLPGNQVLWAHLGPLATPAGDTLPNNPYRNAIFQHTAARTETVGVSLIQWGSSSNHLMLEWERLILDSATVIQVPVSDTTDCIKMLLDQDGDGAYEQIVYPEVGGAAMQLVAMVDGDSVRLNWNSVYCASSYRVYWGLSPDVIPNLLSETADTTCADVLLDSVRFYHVTAIFP
ncbi:MAG: hypothetical protein PHI18_05030, partial [bacterium]|nr:hypothetical protein [bacterium]